MDIHSRIPINYVRLSPHDNDIENDHKSNLAQRLDKNANELSLEEAPNRHEDNLKPMISDENDNNEVVENDGDEKVNVLSLATNILTRAGIPPNRDQQEALLSSLKNSRFHEVYGETPVILGTDQCEVYRNRFHAADRLVAPMGTFNSGTNLLFKSLLKNCAMKERVARDEPESPGMRKQVPWGKHSPSSYRGISTSETGGDVPAVQVFPVIIVKDPFTWMQSFCRHWYNSHWTKIDGHCPNLIPINAREKIINKFKPTFPIYIKYKHDEIEYSSLVDLWNRWYDDYVLQVKFPRMVIRFEDLLFHIEEITTKVCDCVGGEMKPEFQYIVESAKEAKYGHRGASGMLQSMLKYGNTDNRFKDFTHFDKEYALKNLRPDLMKLFRYENE